MFTISLDESAGFESYDENKGPVIIGGVIFDDKGNIKETYAEEIRFHKYMELLYKSLKNKTKAERNGLGYEDFEYPRDLHSRGYNNKQVAVIKEEINKTLADFLKNGNFKGNKIQPERKGTYHLYAMVKSTDGVSSLKTNDVSNISKDSVASNTYIHMAQDTVTKLVFHNPILNIDKAMPILATRATPNIESDAVAAEYKELGHEGKGEGKFFRLTSADIYRTALDNEARLTGKKSIVDEFTVKSIDYSKKINFLSDITENQKGGLVISEGTTVYCGDWKYTATHDVSFNTPAMLENRLRSNKNFIGEHIESEVFLYLADIICSQFTYKMKGNSPAQWISNINKKAKELTGHSDNIIFGYDDIEVSFMNAFRKYEEGDVFSALDILYETKKMKSEFSDYYSTKWIPILKSRIEEDKNDATFDAALSRLTRATRSDSIDQSKLRFIFEALERKSEGFRNKSKLYDLYDAGVSAYNHMGLPDKADECFKKCEELIAYAGAEKFVNTRNKYAVLLNDSLRFGEALSVAKKNETYQENFLEALKGMTEDIDTSFGSVNYAKAISQTGQTLAYLQRPEAVDKFRKALSFFEKGDPNYNITQSYLMHYFLMTKDRENYEKEAEEYFERHDINQQLGYIIEAGLKDRFSLKYALYLYIKSIYLFYFDEISEKTKKRIWNIKNELEKKGADAGKYLSDDPWEHIHKYIALLMVRDGRSEEEINGQIASMRKASGAGKKNAARPSVIELVEKYGEIQIADARGEKEKKSSLVEDLCKTINEKYKPGIFDNMPKDKREDALSQLFSFMYS